VSRYREKDHVVVDVLRWSGFSIGLTTATLLQLLGEWAWHSPTAHIYQHHDIVIFIHSMYANVKLAHSNNANM